MNRDDAIANVGAPNFDSACSGTTMMDYIRGSDFEHFSDEVVQEYMIQRNNGNFLTARSQPLGLGSSAAESAR